MALAKASVGPKPKAEFRVPQFPAAAPGVSSLGPEPLFEAAPGLALRVQEKVGRRFEQAPEDSREHTVYDRQRLERAQGRARTERVKDGTDDLALLGSLKGLQEAAFVEGKGQAGAVLVNAENGKGGVGGGGKESGDNWPGMRSFSAFL